MAVRHRRVGSHELNMESSRSHSIFKGGLDLSKRFVKLFSDPPCTACTGYVTCCLAVWLVPPASSHVYSLCPRAAFIDCTPTRADDHEFGMTRYGKV